MTMPKNDWEERFDEVWADAGNEYPNRKARVKDLIRAEIERADKEAYTRGLKEGQEDILRKVREWAEKYAESIYPPDIWIPLGKRKDEIWKAIDEMMKEKFESRIDVVSAEYARWAIKNTITDLLTHLTNQ